MLVYSLLYAQILYAQLHAAYLCHMSVYRVSVRLIRRAVLPRFFVLPKARGIWVLDKLVVHILLCCYSLPPQGVLSLNFCPGLHLYSRWISRSLSHLGGLECVEAHIDVLFQGRWFFRFHQLLKLRRRDSP